MPVSRGYPIGSAPAVSPDIVVVGGGGGSGGTSNGSSTGGTVDIDVSSLAAGMSDIVAALTETPKEVITGLGLSTGQALVVLAGDYKAYFDLTAYSGSILKVAADAGATLKVYGDLTIDNAAEFWLDNLSSITIKGD